MNYRKMSDEELNALRDEYRDSKHEAARSFGTGMTLVFFVGFLCLIGGFIYTLVSGLSPLNLLLLVVGAACTYAAWRKDAVRRYYEREVVRIDEELAARE